MKKSLFLVYLLLAAAVHAGPCEQSYHFASAYQVILSGATSGGLTQEGTPTVLSRSMGAIKFLSDSIQYKFVMDFQADSSCNGWTKEKVDFVVRKKKETSFSPVSETANSVKLNFGAYPDPAVDFEYWFDFASSFRGDTAVLFETIGKLKNAQHLHVWYGAVLFKKEILAPTVHTLLRTNVGYYLVTTSHPDSAALQKILLASWKNEVANDTQRVTFNVQLIKIDYDTNSVTSARPAPKPKAAAFQTNQVGKLVFIQPGEKRLELSEAVSLYGMMGNKVATLHPTGYIYQWNGKADVGGDAPTGVYFIQSGNRILGKFFYSR